MKQVHAGQAAGFALRKVRRSAIRRGMVLVAPELAPQPCWQFDAEIVVLFHSTTIRRNYQPVVQVLSVRQTARILDMDKEVLRTGDKAVVTFRFMYRPEFMHSGVRLVMREGTTRGMGVITKLYLGSRQQLDDGDATVVTSPIGGIVEPTSPSESPSGLFFGVIFVRRDVLSHHTYRTQHNRQLGTLFSSSSNNKLQQQLLLLLLLLLPLRPQ